MPRQWPIAPISIALYVYAVRSYLQYYMTSTSTHPSLDAEKAAKSPSRGWAAYRRYRHPKYSTHLQQPPISQTKRRYTWSSRLIGKKYRGDRILKTAKREPLPNQCLWSRLQPFHRLKSKQHVSLDNSWVLQVTWSCGSWRVQREQLGRKITLHSCGLSSLLSLMQPRLLLSDP